MRLLRVRVTHPVTPDDLGFRNAGEGSEGSVRSKGTSKPLFVTQGDGARCRARRWER